MELATENPAPRRKRKRKAPAPEAPVAYDLGFSLGLGALSGLLYAFAFPGFDLWPFAFVAQAPLAIALRGQSPRRAALVGGVSGFVIAALGSSWIAGAVAQFGELPAPIAFLVASVVWAQEAGRVVALGWLAARAEQRGHHPALAFAAAFGATELVYPVLFPWFFSVTVRAVPVLVQTADLGGPVLVSVVMLGPSLALAELVWARRVGRPVERRVLAVALAVPLLAALYGVARIASVDARTAAAPAVKVGIAQGNQPAKSRKLAGATYRRLTADLRDREVDLVVWPEGALWEVFPEPTYREELRAKVTGELGVPTVFGSGVVREVAGRKRETNSAFLADATGAIVGRYDKVNLVPFGEHLPLGDTFPRLVDALPNTSHLLPGESMTPLVLGDRRIAPLICIEDMMPSFVNRMVSATDPDLLVNLTIDTWFGHTAEPWAHLAIAEMRAIEHRRFLVRATNSGVSAVIDPVGRRVATSGVFTEETVVAEVRWLRGKTVYEVIGDAPMWLVAAASVAMALRARRGAAAVTSGRSSSAA